VRERWPKPPAWLTIAVEPAAVRRGGEVTVRVDGSGEGRPAGELRYGLVCVVTAAAGTATLHDGDVPGRFRVDRQEYAQEEWRSLGDAREEHTFPVPGQAPYSYDGELLAYSWGVAVRPVAGAVLAWVPLQVRP